MKRAYWLPLLLCLVACTGPLTPAPQPTAHPLPTIPPPQILRILCPKSIQPLMAALVTSYRETNPDTDIVLVERADQLAPQALEQQAADMAALLWIPPALGEKSWHTPFAQEALTLVVNPQNALPGLTLDQIRQLFQGQVEDWAPWGGLPGTPQVISREEESGEYAWFQEQVMGDARVALTALLSPNDETTLALIAEDPLAVGYITAARLDGRVRVLAVDGVPPAPETLTAGLYPLIRPVTFVTLSEPQGAARPFIQWVLSAEGQKVVQQQGYQPLSQ